MFPGGRGVCVFPGEPRPPRPPGLAWVEGVCGRRGASVQPPSRAFTWREGLHEGELIRSNIDVQCWYRREEVGANS